MARPTYSAMLTEVIARVGNHAYTGFSARAELWIAASFYYVSTTWHHPELDGVDETKVLLTGTSSIAFPSDISIPVGIALLKPGTTTVDTWLKPRDFHIIQAHFDETLGKPKLCSRYGDTLYFERNSNADYPIRYFYTKIPAYPLFSGGATSPLSEVFDEIIMSKAVCIGHANLWRPDLSALGQQSLNILLEAVPNRKILDDATADRTTRSKRDQTHMGVQG